MAPIYVSEGASYELHPDGMYPAVCCDVVDLGVVETMWGPKRQVKLVYMTPLDKEDGTPFLLSETHTASLAESSNLRKRLQSWRGRPFTEEELKQFDLENVLGKQCQLQVMHKQGSRGGTFANISNIVPAVKGIQPVEIRSYVREIDRPPTSDHIYGENPENEEESPF